MTKLIKEAVRIMARNPGRDSRAILFDDTSITFTDLTEISGVIRHGLEIDAPFAVDAAELKSVEITEQTRFVTSEETVEIRNFTGSVTLQTVPMKNLPTLYPRTLDYFHAGDIDLGRFLAAAKICEHATTKEMRRRLDCLGYSGNVVAGTDGHRLVTAETGSWLHPVDVTIPCAILPFLPFLGDTAGVFRKENEDKVYLDSFSGWIRFERIRFPDWRKVVSTSKPLASWEVKADEMVKALQPFIKAKIKAMTVFFDDNFVYFLDKPETGASVSSRVRTSYGARRDTAEAKARFNPRYISDFAKICGKKEIRFVLRESYDGVPGQLQGQVDGGTGFVVMPARE